MQTLLISDIAILEIDWPTESDTLPLESKATVHMEETGLASLIWSPP